MAWYDFLRNYDGRVEVNGRNIQDLESKEIDNLEVIDIDITPKSLLNKIKYRVEVKNWMVNSNANFDFHTRWNNGIAMPSNIMCGEILEETAGMYKMSLVDLANNKWVGYVSKVAIISMEEIK